MLTIVSAACPGHNWINNVETMLIKTINESKIFVLVRNFWFGLGWVERPPQILTTGKTVELGCDNYIRFHTPAHTLSHALSHAGLEIAPVGATHSLNLGLLFPTSVYRPPRLFASSDNLCTLLSPLFWSALLLLGVYPPGADAWRIPSCPLFASACIYWCVLSPWCKHSLPFLLHKQLGWSPDILFFLLFRASVRLRPPGPTQLNFLKSLQSSHLSVLKSLV